MTKTVSTSPNSSRSSGWWGSPSSVLLGIVIGGLGGGSVYWLAERSRVHDVVPVADAPIMTVSAIEEPETSPPPAAAPANAPAEPPPSAAETPAEPEAEDEPQPAAEEEDEAEAPAAAAPAAAAAKPEEKKAEAKSDETAEAEDEDDDEKSASSKSEGSGEKAMLQSARAKLRTGDTFGAQVVLEQMRKRYPGGELEQQRELLYIKTQKALGALPAAKRSARAFAQAYPNSPYLGSIESLLLEP